MSMGQLTQHASVAGRCAQVGVKDVVSGIAVSVGQYTLESASCARLLVPPWQVV